jgi:hypothetical protein
MKAKLVKETLNENKRLPKVLFHRLRNIAYDIIEHLSGLMANELLVGDLDDYIIDYWDESVKFNDENINFVKNLIGDIDKIQPYD